MNKTNTTASAVSKVQNHSIIALPCLFLCRKCMWLAVGGHRFLGTAQCRIQPVGVGVVLSRCTARPVGADLWRRRSADGAAPPQGRTATSLLFPDLYGYLCGCGVCNLLVPGTDFHAKWWDYTGYFLNINGRICAMSLLFFALAGMVVVYGLAPLFWRGVEHIPKRGLAWGCAGITFLFLLDLFLSLAAPNLGLGVQILS